MSEADSLTEVIRRALAVYDAIVMITHEDGGKFILRSTDGSEREIMLL